MESLPRTTYQQWFVMGQLASASQVWVTSNYMYKRVVSWPLIWLDLAVWVAVCETTHHCDARMVQVVGEYIILEGIHTSFSQNIA